MLYRYSIGKPRLHSAYNFDPSDKLLHPKTCEINVFHPRLNFHTIRIDPGHATSHGQVRVALLEVPVSEVRRGKANHSYLETKFSGRRLTV